MFEGPHIPSRRPRSKQAIIQEVWLFAFLANHQGDEVPSPKA